MPVTAEFLSNLLHTATVLTNLLGEPTTRAVGDQQTGKANAGIHFAPRPLGTEFVGAEEPTLVPHDLGRASVHGQVHEGNRVAILHPGQHPTLGTSHHDASAFEVNGDDFAVATLDTQNVHVQKVNEHLAHAGRVCFHGGSSNLKVSSTNRLAEPPPFFCSVPRSRSLLKTPRISEVPVYHAPCPLASDGVPPET